jgi:hypothetical protein
LREEESMRLDEGEVGRAVSILKWRCDGGCWKEGRKREEGRKGLETAGKANLDSKKGISAEQ